ERPVAWRGASMRRTTVALGGRADAGRTLYEALERPRTIRTKSRIRTEASDRIGVDRMLGRAEINAWARGSLSTRLSRSIPAPASRSTPYGSCPASLL